MLLHTDLSDLCCCVQICVIPASMCRCVIFVIGYRKIIHVSMYKYVLYLFMCTDISDLC